MTMHEATPAPRSKSVAPVMGNRPQTADAAASVSAAGPPKNARLSSFLSPRSSSSSGSTPGTKTPTTTTPSLPSIEASYVSKVSLRLGDAVNKAFTSQGGQDSVRGRVPPAAERAKEVGDLIYQCVLRSLVGVT
jgi:hypothetical protein